MDARPTPPTLQLLRELIRQGRELLTVEISLARSELKERSSSISSSISAVAAGAFLILAGIFMVLVALSLFLMRVGVPLDLAFMIIAIVVMLSGWILLRYGAQALKPSRLMPLKRISQISSLFGGRLRAGMGETINELRFNLRPSNLVKEVARGVGVDDWSPLRAFEFASKRHPVPAAIVFLR